MGSKRRISYHWQLFLPVAAAICLLIGTLVWYQYRREASYRDETMQKELAIINNRILYAYEKDISLRSFLNFIQQYYRGTIYDGVRISVYDKDGRLNYSLGTPVDHDIKPDTRFRSKNPDTDTDATPGATQGTLRQDKGLYYYSGITSNDGQVKIRTAMPMTPEIHDQLDMDTRVWAVITLLVLTALGFVYLFTRRLTRSVTLLNDFAYRAATGGRFTGLDRFPHNELGDISREIVALYRDRTKALEQVKKERAVAIHAIEEKARVTRQITNNINHEIKTPVGIIRGYLETILDNPDLDEHSRHHFLTRMNTNVERLCSLLNDVSTMTRLEEGGEKVPLEMVDFHDLVYQLNADRQASKIGGDLTFEFDIPLDCKLLGNYNLLSGMICGLMRNSAMHSQGTAMWLKTISENDRYYVFSFADNGTGVADQHLPHLFERFYRVDTGRSRKMGGTGLGLPIVKSTVIALGGTISVRNRSEGGLEFIFSIPRWTPPKEHLYVDPQPPR